MNDRMKEIPENEFPFVDTRAALMLRSGLRRASDERDLSLRNIAKDLGYKQATVLSHMSKGRVPIPLERAVDIADVVGLPRAEFFQAVVGQKSPYAFEIMAPNREGSEGDGVTSTSFVAQLVDLAGSSLEDIGDEQKEILREVMLDQNPRRRWLSPSEVAIMQHLRRLKPGLDRKGLSPDEMKAIEKALSG
ncbi:MAG: helix-turn-helix transcriptional regulator [Sphingopyxis terrae]|nr:helix-turn-helix transcriptional regulator [Sphingopyxis terrae]